MKKIMILVLSAVLLLSMTACACTGDQAASDSTPVPSPTEAPDPINTAALADIMTAILKDAPIEMVTGESAIEEERFSWVFGIEPIEGAEGYSSEAMISSIAHSIALLRVPEGTDAAEVAKQIEEKADPRKWICVEAEKTIVRQRGNVVLLVMSKADIADAVADAFDSYR